MPVNTKTINGRRTLRFQTLDDILADLDGLEGKPLKVLGNWTVGQILKHLAIVMNAAIDGAQFKVAWYIRILARAFRSYMLSHPMPPGFQLPKDAEEKIVPGEISTAEGFAAIRAAIHRLQTETHREPSPMLGKMSVEQFNQLQCRHCELHLSFIVPEPAS